MSAALFSSRRWRHALLACAAAGLATAAAAQSVPSTRPTIRDLVIGAPVSAQPTRYQEFACGTNGGPPSIPVASFAEFARCPVEETGLYEVQFRYDDEAHYLALSHRDLLQAELFAGTKLGNFPILGSALFDEAGILRGVRAVTDDRASDRERRYAYSMTDFVKGLYGAEGWTCIDYPAEAGETPVGNSFIKQDCTKVTADGQIVFTEARLYRRPGQTLIDPANGGLRPGLYISTARLDVFEADSDGNPVYRREAPVEAIAPIAATGPAPTDPVAAFLGGFTRDCPGCELAGADLQRRDLAGADLTGANLTGASLHRAVLAGAKLDGANLSDANLNVTDLKRATLRGANLTNALLYQSDAAGADFTGALMDNVVAENARFTSGIMIGVHWPNAYALGSNLAGTNLSGAVLTGAIFVEADLQRATLTGADVTDVSFYRARLRGADLSGAIAVRTDFLEADLSDARFIGADLTDARLLRARSRGLDLTDAVLTGTILP